MNLIEDIILLLILLPGVLAGFYLFWLAHRDFKTLREFKRKNGGHK